MKQFIASNPFAPTVKVDLCYKKSLMYICISRKQSLYNKLHYTYKLYKTPLKYLFSAGILEVSLEDLLAFWTGASEVPPLGFDHKLRITFNENSQYLLPIAHTCTLVIRLWRGYNDPDQFRCDMIKAITWTGGFHLA